MTPIAHRIRHHAVVAARLSGLRLDQAAATLFADYSRARLQQWIRSGELTLDGQPAKPTTRLWGGEALQIDAAPEADSVVQAEDIPLALLFEDEDLIVVDKPAGLVVHPAAGNRDGTLQNALLYHAPALAALPRSGIVHRLDKDTSGVLVVARSLRAHTSLVGQLQARSMSRVYQAVTRGALRCGGTIDQPIGRHPRDRKRMAVVPGGRPAVTHYRVLQTFAGFTHLQVALETGRTHQIRVHLAHTGFPLVGDQQYAGRSRLVKGMHPALAEEVRTFPRQALHAHTLKLLHPADQRLMEFTSPLPTDLLRLLQCLQEYAV